jgi:RimJ/RimL family protein N-acetyltransferase
VPSIELPDLVDGDLRLRRPTEADVPAITTACQDPDIQRWTRVPSPYREEHARSYVQFSRDGSERLELGYLGLLAAGPNERSNALARRLGFSHEGTLREATIDGPSGDRSAPRCDVNWWGLRPGELT